MVRLREIEAMTAGHEEALAAERDRLAAEASERFDEAWRALVAAWSFDEVNDLIARHNRWYPAESRLPMDPRRRDYALVNGRDYRLRPLDAAWALELFAAAAPSRRSQARGATERGDECHRAERSTGEVRDGVAERLGERASDRRPRHRP
jgi:hypothetical protein